MDTKDINISKSEEEALKIMEDISSVTSGQIRKMKNVCRYAAIWRSLP